jgi:L,D-peptidoglycan transpeptidase YkuD (ErfK/YbiS/YcfS/YnhG family)
VGGFDPLWLTLHSMKPMYFLISLFFGAAGLAVSAKATGVLPDAFAHSTQMVVVTTSDWNVVEGHLQLYHRDTPHQAWQLVGKPISVVVGKNGMGWGIGAIATDNPGVRRASDPVKKEGDGRAPAGVFALGTAFGDASQPLAD